MFGKDFLQRCFQKKNQIFITCSELAEPIATTCTKAHSTRLHQW